ncbi:MAG: hypothetical protein ACYDC3_17570, partial [Candidatus Binataceae bacterium]
TGISSRIRMSSDSLTRPMAEGEGVKRLYRKNPSILKGLNPEKEHKSTPRVGTLLALCEG